MSRTRETCTSCSAGTLIMHSETFFPGAGLPAVPSCAGANSYRSSYSTASSRRFEVLRVVGAVLAQLRHGSSMTVDPPTQLAAIPAGALTLREDHSRISPVGQPQRGIRPIPCPSAPDFRRPSHCLERETRLKQQSQGSPAITTTPRSTLVAIARPRPRCGTA